MILNDNLQYFGTNVRNLSFDISLGGFTLILPHFTMRRNRSGFSLVLSLTMMAAMVLMVIVLASFLQVESRLAQSHSGYLRARFNALASAKIALGQLQQLAGPDQRVTMRADMYADNDQAVNGTDGATVSPSRPTSSNNYSGNNAPSSGRISHQKRYLTGVWATGGVNSTAVRDWDVTNPNESRLFLGWLASPWDVTKSTDLELSGAPINYVPNATFFTNDGGTTGKRRKANMGSGSDNIDDTSANYIGQTLINQLATAIGAPTEIVPLVSYGTVNLPAGLTSLQRNYMGAVDARPQPMPGPAFPAGINSLGVNGRYAFWIGDEGVKAKVNLPDAYGNNNGGGTSLATTDWDKGFAASAAMRNSIGTIGGAGTQIKEGTNNKGILPAGFNFDTWRNKDISDAGDASAFQLAKVIGIPGLSAWAAKMGGTSTAGQAMTDATKVLWHDLTTWSYSTLTDTYNGGAKTDLSTAFEMPYSMYRGVEVYPLQKNSAATTAANRRKQSFFHGAPSNVNSSGNDLGYAVDLDYNRPNMTDAIGTASQLLEGSPRASEWAPRYTKGLLGTSYNVLLSQNGGTPPTSASTSGSVTGTSEVPERMGFVYEAPLRSAFFNTARDAANTEISNNALGVSLTGSNARINSYPWAELAPTAIENLSGRITRGPTWDLYRNFYRMYKKEIEACSVSVATANRGQVAPLNGALIARGVEPLSFASGNRNEPMAARLPVGASVYPKMSAVPGATGGSRLPDNFFADGSPVGAGKYFYRNNLSAPSDAPLFQGEQRLRYPFILPNRYATGVTNFDRTGLAKPSASLLYSAAANTQALSTRPWPTAMSLTPSIIRFSMVFSGVYEGKTAANLGGTIGVAVDPVIVVYNPYDCPIEFEGIAMVTNGPSVPFIFDISLKNWTFDSTSPQYYDPNKAYGPLNPVPVATPQINQRLARVSRDLLLGEVALGDGDYENRSFSFRVSKGTGKVFRLEPGEVKVLSSKYDPAGNYTSTRASNTSLPGAEGFNFGATAVYKMTPFANVRVRTNTVAQQMDTNLTQYPVPTTHDSRLWTWGFSPSPMPLGTSSPVFASAMATLPDVKFIGDYCTNYLPATPPIDYNWVGWLWSRVQSQRDIHDALKGWDGSAVDLKRIIDFYGAAAIGSFPMATGSYQSLMFTMRNSGGFSYDGCVVGEEAYPYAKTPFDAPPTSGAPPVFPRKRAGNTNLGGHQVWNFYLLGNKDYAGTALNVDRRWFGAPDYSSAAANTLATVKYEGTETAGGFHQVDEPLLLSFHAMTAGWPMYGNDNAFSSNITVTNQDWMLKFKGLTPPDPDYRVPTGITGRNDGISVGTSSAITILGTNNPGGDPEYGYIENTGSRANTLQDRVAGVIRTSPGTSGTKQQFFMSDFVLRAADMTSDAGHKWYPLNKTTTFSGAKNYEVVTPYSWTGSSNVDTLRTPAEMLNAPMTPYFLSIRPQSAHLYAYDGKAHTPIGWILSEKQLDYSAGTFGNLQVSSGGQNAYWGKSIAPSGVSTRSDVILFPVPRRPLLSLAQLGSVGAAQVITDADFTVGSSFANPGISDLTKITDWPGPKDYLSGDDVPVPEHGYVGKVEGTRPIRNYAQVRTDHAFAANLALWDGFYFSGLNLQAPSYSFPAYKVNYPGGPDLPIDATVASQQLEALKKATGNSSLTGSSFSEIKDALNAGYNPLANKRMLYLPDLLPAADAKLFPQATEFPHPGYLARNSLYDGGFNVNSTSTQAWKAVLSGLRGQTIPDGTTTTGTVLSRFARNFMPSSNQNAWNSYRELTDAEIEELAGLVVKEVRDRGPFMSLADFINRRLLASNHGLKGALQAAIDKSTINNTAITAAGGPASGSSPAGTFAHPAAPDYTDPNGIPDATNYQFRAWDFLLKKPGLVTRVTSKQLPGSPNPPTPTPRFPSLNSMDRTGVYKTAADRASSPETSITTSAVAGLGAPQLISQMDVLNSVGPNLTARSDTFTIRAYGEALDNAGNSIGRAWVELVVQRTPYYIAASPRGPAYEEANRRKLLYRPTTTNDPLAYDNDPIVDFYESVNSDGALGGLPSTGSTKATQAEIDGWAINRLLGRRFKTTNVRWLNANEI